MSDGKVSDRVEHEIIDLPLPSEEQRLLVLEAQATIEVDEIPQKAGYFSVDYRRC